MVRKLLSTEFIGITLLLLFSLYWLFFSVDTAKSDTTDPHNDIQCATCHSLSESSKIVKTYKCNSCHHMFNNDTNLNDFAFHNDKSRNCIDCHSFHSTDILIAKGTKFRYDFVSEKTTTSCITCHKSNSSLSSLSKGHWEARKIYHQNDAILTLSQSCMVCHSDNVNSFELDYDNTSMPTINSHASHPYEIDVVRGQSNSNNRIRFEIKPAITLFNNRIECQTCHTLTTENKYLLANTENQSLFCTGCHEHEGDRMDLVSNP